MDGLNGLALHNCRMSDEAAKKLIDKLDATVKKTANARDRYLIWTKPHKKTKQTSVFKAFNDEITISLKGN